MSDKERAVQSTLNQIWNRLYNGELKDPTIKWTDSPYRDLLNALFDAGWAARSEASAWVPIRSAEDLPKGTPRFYIWQSKYNPNRMHVEARCSESPVMVKQTLDNYIAWRELPSPYTADSGKEKG